MKVRETAARQKQRSPSRMFRAFARGPGQPVDEKPWVPDLREECEYKICHTCYRGGIEKAWLSLNAVVNGEIPPTAATAWTFQYMQQRPVSDSEVIKSIGCRAVPMVRLAHLVLLPS